MDKFYDYKYFCAELLGLNEAAQTVTIFSGIRMTFFRTGFILSTEPVSSNLVVHIFIALTYGNKS